MNLKDQEYRKQKRFETLGTNTPVCISCGEKDWRCLEQHHMAGQAYADDLSIICRNCHRKLSDDQKDHPEMIGEKPINSEIIGHMLLGLADFLALLVIRLKEFGQYLIETSRQVVGKS